MNNSIKSSDEDSVNENLEEEIEEKIYKYNGEEIIKKYLKGKFLGKGGFAKCYEIKSLHNKKTYAAKIVSKQNLIKQSAKIKLKSEIKIHKSLFHNNIVKFEHVFEDSQNVYILLELCHNNTLNEMLKKRKVITELETKYFLDQILKGVKFMHKNKVIHRDLKLGNLFLNEKMELKIGDFGLATALKYEGERKHTVCGTPNYIAPEILVGKEGHSFEVDFWAIGVIVYTLLIGKPPYETNEVKETYKRIQENIFSFPNDIFVSEVAKDFIRKTLITNPSQRLNLENMQLHPFITKHPIPKSIPAYLLDHPPTSQFYREYRIETLNLEDINDLSYINETDDFNIYLKEVKKFASNNVKRIPVENPMHRNISTESPKFNKDNLNKNIRNLQKNIYDYNSVDLTTKNNQTNSIRDMLNRSDKKETHKLLQKNASIFDHSKLNFVENIVDYSKKFGFIYRTNRNVLGMVFKDKSCLFKNYNKEEFFYIENLSSKTKTKKNRKVSSYDINKLTDVPSEIRMKLEILLNYEKYLDKSQEIKPTKDLINVSHEKNIIYVKKIIITEKCYLIKLSNDILQVRRHINITFKCDFLVNILR